MTTPKSEFEREPREFWLHKAYQMPWTVHLKPLPDAEHGLERLVHVIEYSAYGRLEAENKELKYRLEKQIELNRGLKGHEKELESQVQKLRAALERIANANGDPRNMQFEALSTYNMIGIAKQALGGEGI